MADLSIYDPAPANLSSEQFFQPGPGGTQLGGNDSFIFARNPDNTIVAIGGAGFVLDAGGVPTAGTVTAVVLYASDFGIQMASFGGLSVAAVDLYALWRGASPGNVFALLLAGDDQISGSTLANLIDGGAGNDTITGGLGNDTITGGGGTDTVILAGAYADYTTTAGPLTPSGVTLIVTGPDGTDTLVGVESLQFDDQTIPAATSVLSIAATDAVRAEGNSGTTAYTFTVNRLGDTAGNLSAKWSVTGGGGGDAANAADFVGGVFPSGTVSFTTGETSKIVTINVASDTNVEPDESFTVSLSGAPADTVFQNAAAVGTITDDDAPCFAAGTRILTARGEVAVQNLVAGDEIPVATGGAGRHVRWVGHRAVALARHRRPWDVQPVRVHAHAFAPGQPHSDLWLSPDHAVLADGVLIPIRYLINGATIVQESVAEVSYYHVELARADGAAVHDVVLAQGLPAESYLDTGNRAAFANGGPAVLLHPDFACNAWQSGCAPLVLEGPVVESVRVELQAQATTLGHSLSTDPHLHLVVDGAVVAAERNGPAYRFVLPERARDVRLVSLCTVPAETRPDSSDTRRLGVAVTSLTLDGATLALDDKMLAGGWLVCEENWRWTTGNAALSATGGRELTVNIANLERYWVRSMALTRRARTAAA